MVALSVPTLEGVRAHRDALVELARRRHLTDVRVCDPVARGDARAGSDVDQLVRPGPAASVFDLAGFMAHAAAIVGVPVDVVSDRATGAIADAIRAEAVPL